MYFLKKEKTIMRDVYEILKEKNIVLPEPPAKGRQFIRLYRKWEKSFCIVQGVAQIWEMEIM